MDRGIVNISPEILSAEATSTGFRPDVLKKVAHLLSLLDALQSHIAFIVYGAMNRKDWRTVSIEDVNVNETELTRQLVPVLRLGTIPRDSDSEEYGKTLIAGCRKALAAVLPFTDTETRFPGSTARQRRDRSNHPDR